MHQKPSLKISEEEFKKFIDYRNGLTSFDKKLEAGAILDQIGSVEVDKAWNKVALRLGKSKKKYVGIHFLIRVAAVFTLPLLAFTIWSLFLNETPNEYAQSEITFQEVQSPPGMRSHIILPDGSNLWLNAGSFVRYGIPFIGGKREIELSGEAYLEVVSDKESPFLVNVQDATIEVLGTSFNVKSNTESDKIEVALKEGKVNFYYQEEKPPIEINPNDYLQYDVEKKTISVDNLKIEKYIAWHNNILILDETPMDEVARLLEQWYGVKVVLGDETIKKYKFTTTFDNEPLFRVLELLELSSPITIQYMPGKPDAVTKKLNKSIVTINKK